MNVITKRPGKDPSATLRFEAGDFGFLNLAGSTSVRMGNLGISLVGNVSTHDKIDRDGDGVSEYTGYDRAYVSGTA